MKKDKRKEVLILGDKKKVIKRLERRAKEAIYSLERFENGTFLIVNRDETNIRFNDPGIG